jgi:hypothetical protein
MRTIITNHTLLTIYSFVFLILVFGVYISSGFTYFNFLFIFYIAFISTYLILIKVNFTTPTTRFISKINEVIKNKQIFLLLILVVMYTLGFMIYHLYILNGSPAISALIINSSNEVAALRNSITDNASTFVSYQSSIVIKGILPVSILFLLIFKKYKLYYLLLIMGCFYTFSLMQKSYIVTFLLPSIIYTVLNKKYWQTLLHLSLIVCVSITLTLIANPEIKNETNFEIENNIDAPQSKLGRIIYGLSMRVFIVPGKVVAEWFDNIPAKKQFLYGKGYRLYANLSGMEYHDYSSELYPILRPQYAQQGLTGTVNSASFMYDYANFGKIGLILSGLVLAIYLLFVETVFHNDVVLKLSLNCFQVFLLSSTALTTSIFSGGWFVIILMYILFKPFIKNQYTNAPL